MQGFWAAETSEPPNEGPTTTPALPPPGPLRSPAIGGPDVVDTFTAAVNRWDTPASVLTDGAIFTAIPRRGGRTALKVVLGALSINYLSSRPYPSRRTAAAGAHAMCQRLGIFLNPAGTLRNLSNFHRGWHDSAQVGRSAWGAAGIARSAAFDGSGMVWATISTATAIASRTS